MARRGAGLQVLLHPSKGGYRQVAATLEAHPVRPLLVGGREHVRREAAVNRVLGRMRRRIAAGLARCRRSRPRLPGSPTAPMSERGARRTLGINHCRRQPAHLPPRRVGASGCDAAAGLSGATACSARCWTGCSWWRHPWRHRLWPGPPGHAAGRAATCSGRHHVPKDDHGAVPADEGTVKGCQRRTWHICTSKAGKALMRGADEAAARKAAEDERIHSSGMAESFKAKML